MRKFVLIVFALVAITFCARLRDCDLKEFNSVFNLVPSRLAGTWYPLVVSTNSVINNCLQVNFSDLANGNYSLEMGYKTTNEFVTFPITISPNRIDTFVTAGDNTQKLRSYTVLDSDYTTFMVGIYCHAVGENGYTYYVHIFSRTDTLPEDLITTLQNTITSILPNIQFKRIIQGSTCVSTR